MRFLIANEWSDTVRCKCGAYISKCCLEDHLGTERHVNLMKDPHYYDPAVTRARAYAKSCAYKNQLVVCECGWEGKRGSLNQHRKSKQHLTFTEARTDQ